MTIPPREKSLELLKKYNSPEDISDWNHFLESEAIMKKLAERFNEDQDYWATIGLLHDLDWGLTKNNLDKHCIKVTDILKENGYDETFIKTVQSHGYGLEIIPELKDKKRSEKIEHSLVAAETITGLIYAYALMRGRKISDMEVKGLKKKFSDKAFAANCNRELIKEIEKTGLNLEEFFEISIEAIKEISKEIGLD
jgi:uncharacterized protein